MTVSSTSTVYCFTQPEGSHVRLVRFVMMLWEAVWRMMDSLFRWRRSCETFATMFWMFSRSISFHRQDLASQRSSITKC